MLAHVTVLRKQKVNMELTMKQMMAGPDTYFNASENLQRLI